MACFTPAFGHLRPLLAIALAARDAGMTVACFVPEELADASASLGLETVSTGPFYGTTHPPDLSRFAARGTLGQIWHGEIEWTRLGRLRADAELSRSPERIEDPIRSFGPDALLADHHRHLPLARYVAGRLGVPLVTHLSSGSYHPFQPPAVFRHGPGTSRGAAMLAGAVVALRNRTFDGVHRLTSPAEWREDRSLIRDLNEARRLLTERTGDAPPSELQIATGIGVLESKYLPDRIQVSPEVRMLGPLPPPRPTELDPDLEGWLTESEDEPVVLVAFGSMLPAPARTTNALVRALDPLPVRVLWGSPTPPETLKGLERDTKYRWEAWVPQVALLAHPRVKAFVTHGGSGGVQEALWFGKPLLCIPLAWDQFYNARVVEILGAGLRHRKGTRRSAVLRRQIAALVSGGAYTRRAEELSAELKRADGRANVLRVLREAAVSSH